MTHSVRLTLALTLLAGACNTDASAPAVGRLTAAGPARAFGVAAYVPNRDGADLLDDRGHSLGLLTITEPEANTRYLRIDLVDGNWYDSELTGEVARGIRVNYTVHDLMEAVQTDPALAPLFAGHNLYFGVAKTDDILGQPLAPSSPPEWCSPPPNPSCRAFSCTVNENWYYGSGYYACGDEWESYGNGSCNGYCAGTVGTVAWASGYGPNPSYEGCGSLSYCDCAAQHYKTTNNVSCPRVSCGTAGQCDLVLRVRTCEYAGGSASCSNAGSGYAGCTTQLPASGSC